MQTDAHPLWSTRIVTFAVSALAAASVAYWGVKGWGAAMTATPPTVALTVAPPEGALARALGGGKTAKAGTAGNQTAVVSRYALLGVVASRGRGAALISVDGQEAKPVRVGNPVDGGLVLKSVTARRAVLAGSLDAPAQITLELPLPGS
ncbi:MAG: type II secretion system protein N [Polaromonas sp.]